MSLQHLAITLKDIEGISLFDDLEKEEDFEETTGDIDVSYKLSTMTICGNLGGDINIINVLEKVDIQPYWALREGIIRIEGYSGKDILCRGISRKYIEKKASVAKPFHNSVSLYYRLYDEDTLEAREPSVKLFDNGSFQITGIRTPLQATKIVDKIKKILLEIPDTFKITNLGYTDVCMMNSDLTFPYQINREKLQDILLRYGIISTYETTNYQGVNIKFFWNHEKHKKGIVQNGICECETVCNSSGKKNTMSDPSKKTDKGCVRITIAPFQTGKVIITGAKHEQQVKDSTNWIKELCSKHHKKIFCGKAKHKKKSTRIPFRGGRYYHI